MITTSFFKGALLPGTGASRARHPSRTAQPKEKEWLPSREVYVSSPEVHQSPVPRAEAASSADPTSTPIQEVVIPVLSE